MMFDRILVPLDGSKTAEAALAYAVLLPSRRLWLLTVEDDGGDLAAVCGEARTCQEYLNRLAEPIRQRGRDVETLVVSGNPIARILDFADRVDLVVMGSHGYGPLERFVLGSVADHVARQASVPVLIVRERQERETPARVARLVVPLDGSALAEQAIPVASELAAALGASIHLVRVLDVDPLRASVQAGIPAARASIRALQVDGGLAEQYLAKWAQKLRDQNFTVTTAVLLGNPVAMLLDTIQPDDLVVMTTHGLGGLRRWVLGSVATDIVRAATAPVLLVRAAARKTTSAGMAAASIVEGST